MKKRSSVIGGMLGMVALAVCAEEASSPLFPFLISYDAPDNAVSMAHLLDAPAGKHGFVRVQDGRFVTDKGRIRFHATNLTGPANFPTHAQADETADRLARFGINCVRLHYFDAEYGNFMTAAETGIFGKGGGLPGAFGADPAKPFRLDPEAVDRQDYLIAALKKRGIYVNMNLHVARFPKGLSFFDPLMIASEKAYAKALLTRVNPYTKLAYTDDPCVAMIEINNENAFFNNYNSGAIDRVSGRVAEALHGQWNAWLKKKYGSTEAMTAAWKWVSVPLSDEQVAEGAFDGPVAIDGRRWILAKGSAAVTAAAEGGALRVAVARGGDEFFPKLFRRVAVQKDKPYTVSFKVRRTQGEGNATLGFAVADAKEGWRSLGAHEKLTVGKAWHRHSFAFIAADTSDKAEIQFTRFPEGTFEIDDLSLQNGAVTAFDEKSRIETASVPVVKSRDFAPPQARADFTRFIWETEHAYWTGIADYVKKDLKAKAPISGTQLGYSPPQLQAELDYVDSHSYWCHPSVNAKWAIRNETMVNSLSCIIGLAAQRVQGKPYTVSEYNHPFPNQYGAEGQPMLRAYGALQGWDGVFEYTYNHSPDFNPRRNTYFFSMIARTDVLAHFPACAAMYLRGDVREAQGSVVGRIDDAAFFDRLVKQRAISASIGSCGIDSRYALVHKVAMAFPAEPADEAVSAPKPAAPAWGAVIVSDTGELTWNRERPGKAFWTVDTPNTKLFCGFPEGREIALDGVRLAVGPTRLGWATVSLTSRHATGFGAGGAPATILLTATGVSENEGTQLEALPGNSAALRDRTRWGEGTVWVEGVPAVVTLPSAAAKTRCYALDERGARKGDVPVESVAGGCRVAIGPQYKTVWYEIEVKQ
ncbi:MAG TPA: hypothetical protein PLT74_11355 [Kiritimatiellia bacterium]|nr:hypothetical protein [Kiritimatiellia bacterium]